MNIKKFLKLSILTLMLLVFTSCSALYTTVSKKNLDVQTKMSETIWLEPVEASQKTIFLDIRNTSGKNLDIANKIAIKIAEKGYAIVSNPSVANYWLQVNVLKVDKVNLRDGEEVAFSDGILAGGIGAMLGAQRSGGAYTAVGWGLAAATISTITDALIKDVNYAMLTDILITEKTGRVVQSISKNAISQGTSGMRIYNSSQKTNSEKYATRVLSIANKVNLKFEQATPILEEELVKVISGIF